MPIKRKTIVASKERLASNRQQYQNVDFSDYAPTEEPLYRPTLQFLENDKDFQEDMETYMAYIGSRDDGFLNEFLAGNFTTDDWKEFLRDEDWKLTSVIDRKNALQDAPEEVKQAYNRVRGKWDNADTEGYAEWVEALQDIGADILTDPINLTALLSIPFSGGGSAAAGALAKEGAKKSAMTTLKRMAPTFTGAAEGGVWTGVDNYNRQNIEIATGLRNEFSNRDLAISTGLGTTIGGAIGFGLGQLVNGRNASKVERDIVPDNKALNRQVDNLAANDDEIVGNIIEGNLPQSQEVVDAVSEIVSKLPLRSATFQNNVLNETRGFPVDFNIDDFAEVDEVAKDLAEKLGGSDYTADEIADAIRQALVAAKRGNVSGDELSDFVTGRITKGLDTPAEQLAPTTPDPSPGQEVARPIQNKLLFKIGRIANKLNSTVLAGKATDLISPYAKYSPTAARLQRLLRYDSSLKLTGSLTPDEKLGRDYFETLKENFGTFVTDFKRAYDPIMLGAKGDNRQAMDDMIVAALRGGALPDNAPDAVKDIVPQLRKLFDDRAEALFMEEVPANYVPRMWKRSAIEENQFEFKKLLENEGYNPEEANTIVNSMLGKVENAAVIDSAGTGDTIFLMPRVLDKIADDNVYADFLESDLNKIVHEYGIQSARRISKLNVLGVRNLTDFQNIWIPQIQKELREAGLERDPLIGKATQDITSVYSSMTGEGVQRYGTAVQTAADAYTMTTRMATLPLATLSSLTEIFINISKAGFRNSFKGFAGAMNEGFDTIATKSKNLLADSGLTEPEIWREMQELGIAMDQAAGDVADRLGGEAISNKAIRNVNNAFFRANMLDQWTKFVQMTSYISGKNMIADNITEIASARGISDSRRILRKKKELRELGIDIDQAMDWFDGGMKADDAFNKEIQRGAGRYTNEVILNPEAASGLKPLLHSNPKTSILFQLMGYPAAFTNTVLKNAARKMIEDPVGNLPNTLAAGVIMTETARFNNWARSGGRSEEEGENPYAAAIMRWGGGGTYLDMFRRAEFAAKDSPALAPILGISGPLTQDIFALARYQGPVEFAARKTPGFGGFEMVFGRPFRDNYLSSARAIDRNIKEGLDREGFRKGGVVEVPNAPEEPDERVDRLTGMPYDQQAGGAFIDEEEREGFSTGGIGKVIANKISRSVLSDAVGKIANKGENIPFNRLMKRLEVEGVRPDEIQASRLIDLVDEKDIVTTRSGNKAVTPEGLRNAEARRTDVFKQEESTYLEAQEKIEEVAEDLEREVEMVTPRMEAEYAQDDEILSEAFSEEDFQNIENPDPTSSYTGYLLNTAFNPEEPLRARQAAVEEIERVLDKRPADFKEMYSEVVPEDAELNTYYIRYFSDPRVTAPTESGHFVKGLDYSEDLNFVYWTRGDVASGDKTITGGEASRVYEIQSDSRVGLDPQKLSPYQKLLQEAEKINNKLGEIEDDVMDVDLKLEEFNTFVLRSDYEGRSTISPDAPEEVKTLLTRNNELMDALVDARKQERDIQEKITSAEKDMTATQVAEEKDQVFNEGTKVPINVWKNAIYNEIVKAKEQGLDEIQFLIDDKMVEKRGERLSEFMSRSPEIQKAYETIVAPLVIKTAKKIGARAQRKGKYIAFALPASFTLPLYAQEEEDVSAVATDLSLGMELDEALVANRDDFQEGGIVAGLLNLVGRGNQYQADTTIEAVELNNRLVNAGLLEPRSHLEFAEWETEVVDGKRVPVKEEGSEYKKVKRILTPEEYRNFQRDEISVGVSGDEEAFNAINHAILGYDNAYLGAPLIQGREILSAMDARKQGKDPNTEHLDRWNNSFGIKAREDGLSREQFYNRLIDSIANVNNEGTRSKLMKGIPLQRGVDLLTDRNLVPQDFIANLIGRDQPILER